MIDAEVIPDATLEEKLFYLDEEQVEQLKEAAGLFVKTLFKLCEVIFEQMSEAFGELAEACKEIINELELDADINEKVYDSKLIIHLFNNNPSEKVEKIYKWPQPP